MFLCGVSRVIGGWLDLLNFLRVFLFYVRIAEMSDLGRCFAKWFFCVRLANAEAVENEIQTNQKI